MAIVDMTRFRLTIFDEDRLPLLKRLQSFDWVDFTDLTKDKDLLKDLNQVDAGRALSASEEEMSRLEEAIRILTPYQEKDTHLKAKYSDQLPKMSYQEARKLVAKGHPHRVANEAMDQFNRIESSKEKIRSLEEEIKELDKWHKLDVPMEKLRASKQTRILLGTMPARWVDPTRRFIAEKARQTYVEFLGGDDRTAFVLFISRGEEKLVDEFLRDINFTPAHLAEQGTIQEAIAAKEEQIRDQEKGISQAKVHLKKMTREDLPALQAAYELQAHIRNRLSASGNFVESRRVNFLEGFVPTEKLEDFKKVLADHLPEGRYDLETKEAERTNPDVPIILKNNRFLSNFESIIKTYALPLYKEMDPTPLYALWYMFFFGIMLGDLGYGVILLVATTWALHYFNFKESTRKAVTFLQIMSLPTIVAGLCFGSVFGGLIPLKPLIIDPTVEIMPMVVFSVVVGIIHILYAMALSAVQSYRMHDPKAAFYDVYAWYMILIGLIAGGLGKAKGWPPILCKSLFIMAGVGAVIVILFSARDEKGGARIAWGIYNLYGVTSYIGDFASYTRLMALCLSGAYIGFSFNLICKMLAGGGWPLAIIAAILGVFLHLFNLFLSGLSAYVHSMRLIYVEFFGKFYEGGGKAFKKMRPAAKYIDLK